MATLPEQLQESPTVRAIYDALKRKDGNRLSRRLGASIVGKACERAVWYDFRWCARERFDGRMLRLFQTGHIAEVRFMHELRDIGCEVLDVDPETGEQWEFVAVGGHFVCKLDAALVGIPEAEKTWHAGEFKTHNAKSFADLKGKGLQQSKPQHYAQLLIGMTLSGMKRGLYLAANKDTDELYAERLRWEEHKDAAEQLLDRAKRVVESKAPPARISDKADDFRCRFCAHAGHCHGVAVPVVTCRSCVHATPVIEENGIGRWVCEKHERTLSEQDQERACDDHLYIPDLLAFASVNDGGYDAGGDWVLYENGDGTTWRNTKQPNGYRSHELEQLPVSQIGRGQVDQVKRMLGATVVAEVGA